MTRLYIPSRLSAHVQVDLNPDQAHYLLHVLRLEPGHTLHVFNGQDGEWQAQLTELKKNKCTLQIVKQLRQQTRLPPLKLAFAPLKHEALLYLIEKATELGVTALQPIITERTNIHRINLEKIARNTIEAAQQCERLCLPETLPLMPLRQFLNDWPEGGSLVVCREREAARSLTTVLKSVDPGPITFLVGPEGGFSTQEITLLSQYPFVSFCHLGPRILRAETAALAALSGFQLLLGDWQDA